MIKNIFFELHIPTTEEVIRIHVPLSKNLSAHLKFEKIIYIVHAKYASHERCYFYYDSVSNNLLRHWLEIDRMRVILKSVVPFSCTYEHLRRVSNNQLL